MTRGRQRRIAAACLGALMVATALAFLSLAQVGKVWEDDETVFGNPFMFGPRHIPYLFTPDYWVEHDVARGAAYRPLVQASFALEYALWRGRPAGYHATNIALHAVAVLVCYLLVAQLTGQRRLALLAAAVFALHPTRAEAVGWLKNRAELMCSILVMLSLLSFHRATIGRRRVLALGGTAALLALALLCKGLAIVMPLAAVAYVACCVPRPRWPRALAATAPLWAVVAAYVAFKLLVLSGDVPHQGKPVELALGQRLMIPGWTALFYEKLLALPTALCADRDFASPFESVAANAGASALGWAIALAPFGLVLSRRWRGSRAFFTWWFLIVLLPYVNIIYMEVRPRADQRLYLPGLAYCYVVALVGCAAGLRGGWRRPVGVGLAGAAIVALTALTVQRNFAWTNMYTLFHDAAVGAPGMARVHTNLGAAYYEMGRLRTAQRHMLKAMRLDPQPVSCRWLGLIYARLGDTQRGIAYLKRAFSLAPESVTCRTLGNVYMQLGRWGKAAHWLQEACRIRPYNPQALYLLGMCRWRQGDLEAAQRAFDKAIEQRPDHPDSHFQLGNVHLRANRPEQAVRCYRDTLEIAPNHAGAQHNLGLALAALDRDHEAERALERAIRLDPTMVSAYANLAKLYARRQQWPAAASRYQTAVNLAPNNPTLWHEFAQVLERVGELDKAAYAHDVASKLAPSDWALAVAAGDCARRRGRLTEALRHYAQALKFNPDCARASAAVDDIARVMREP